MSKSGTYSVAFCGLTMLVLAAIPIVPVQWIIGGVEPAGNGAPPFAVGDRVISITRSTAIPKGALGRVTGTPLMSKDCRAGKYKVVYDAYPRHPAPDDYWCEWPTEIERVQ